MKLARIIKNINKTQMPHAEGDINAMNLLSVVS